MKVICLSRFGRWLAKWGFPLLPLLCAHVAWAGSVTLDFSDAVQGRSFYAYDGDRDGNPDIVVSTADPFGFNTFGPGPNMRFIQEPGIEGRRNLPTDLRLNFVRGAVNEVSFGFAVSDGQGGQTQLTFGLYDVNNQLLASSVTTASFQNLTNGSQSSFPEAQVALSFSGTAAYGLLDFAPTAAGNQDFGRYILDNLSTDFAGATTLPGFGGIIPSDPILPGAIVPQPDGSVRFDFNLLPLPNGPGVQFPIFIDPVVAVGYDYRVTSGPRFAAVLIPAALPNGDGEFLLQVDGFANQLLLAGTEFDLLSLDPLGVEAFRIVGINATEGLDPANPLAFVTGLRFTGGGAVTMSQTSITTTVNAVPEPGTMVLVLAGFLGVARLGRRRRP